MVASVYCPSGTSPRQTDLIRVLASSCQPGPAGSPPGLAGAGDACPKTLGGANPISKIAKPSVTSTFLLRDPRSFTGKPFARLVLRTCRHCTISEHVTGRMPLL